VIRAARVARRFVIPLALAAVAGCGAPTPSTISPAAIPTADVSGTVTAQVRATIQALGATRNGSPATPPPAAPASTATVAPVALPIVLDERFTTPPRGWPDDADGVAWHADGAYHLAPREDGHFVALGAPLIGALGDVVVSATFRKMGGPPGGGYGLIVHDQNPDSRDGTDQGGRFIVAEIGDAGTIGIWRREDDHWVDLVPWTPSTAVLPGEAANELTVQTIGDEITLLANGTQVGHVSMGVDKGGVGVFVGGDGNQVALERFTVRAGASEATRNKADSTTTTLTPAPIPVAPALAPAQSTLTPPLSVTFQVPDIANKDKEIGCGAFCVWYASVDSITRTNDPLVADQPLGQGEEFVIATITFNANGKERMLAPETDFRLDGGPNALPASQLRLQGALTGMLAKGQTRTGPVVFKVRAGQPLTTLFVKGQNKDEKALDVRDPSSRLTALQVQLEQSWAAQDWPAAINLLTQLRTALPDEPDYKDKLYAAYINNADKLTAAGDRNKAAAELSKAVQLDDGRDEAKSRQLALTPTPTYPTATATVLPKVGESAQLGNWAIKLTKVETAQVLGTQFLSKQAQGLFVVLTVSAANVHNQTSTLNSWDFQMLGAGDIKYKVSSDGSTVLLGDEPAVLWASEQIQPGLTKSFRLVFDVNPAVKNYVLEAAKIKFAVDLP
jgi:hypothetical protein